MDRRFRYRQKTVQDITCDHGLVRVWDTDGDIDRRRIIKAFTPLLRTGFVHPYVALMPDHHPGESSMVGSVISTRDVLLLSVIGGDLGCGVTALKLPVRISDLKGVLMQLRESLRASIPTGAAHNASVSRRVEENPLGKQDLQCGLASNRLKRKLVRQFASLGGGNHFLELQEGTDGMAWLMLHSGSRYLGVLIKDHYIDAGSTLKEVDQQIYRKIPYLPAECDLATAYMSDLSFALTFARESRKEMMLRAIAAVAAHSSLLREATAETVAHTILDVAHNYVVQEKHFGENLFVHRKGAVRAFENETVMIPGSMGTASYIAEFSNGENASGNTLYWSDAEKRAFASEFRRGCLDQWSDKHRITTTSSTLVFDDVGVQFDIRTIIGGWTTSDHWELSVTKVDQFAGSSVNWIMGNSTIDSHDTRGVSKCSGCGGTAQRGSVHEFGHMLGLRDEYPSARDNLSHTGDHQSVMNHGETVRARHYAPFADWLTRQYAYTARLAGSPIDFKVNGTVDMSNANL